MKNKFFLTILVLLLVLSLARLSTDTERTGFFYPGGCLDCHDERIIQPGFSTLSDCRARANQIQKKRRNLSDDFECGKNCKKTAPTQRSCDETKN